MLVGKVVLVKQHCMRLRPDSLHEGICVADDQVHLRLRHEMRTLGGWWPTGLVAVRLFFFLLAGLSLKSIR